MVDNDRIQLISQLLGMHTTMVGAAERLNNEIELQLSLTHKRWSGKAKQDWGMLLKSVESVKFWYDKWLKDAQPALKLQGEDGENPVQVFDSLLADSNTLVLVELLVYNATYGHNENMSKIIEYLLGLCNEDSPIKENVLRKFNFIESYEQ